MKTRPEIIDEIADGLRAGIINEADLRAFLAPETPSNEPISQPTSTVSSQAKDDHVGVIDVIFYVAGIILFAALISLIAQTQGEGSFPLHLFLTTGVGLGLWLAAYFLKRSEERTDLRNGLVNAMLLTGSLGVIAGIFVITSEVLDNSFNSSSFATIAALLFITGIIHIAYNWLIDRKLILLMGILLCVASFPVFMVGPLRDASAGLNSWIFVWLITGGLLFTLTRGVTKITRSAPAIGRSFDSLAVFIALLAIYTGNYGDYGPLWLGALIIAIIVIFYLSIVLRSRYFLGIASFFLVVSILTISFKYFSDFGVTGSLIISTIGLLGTAAAANHINKKYLISPQ